MTGRATTGRSLAVVGVLLLAGCTDDSTTPASTAPAPPATAGPTTAPAVTEPAVTDPAVTDPAVTDPDITAGRPHAFAFVDGRMVDPSRDRTITYRVYAPTGTTGPTPVIVVSHGGFGNRAGHTSGRHLGEAFATAGYLAVHAGHWQSATDALQLTDRPADVTFLLDRLAAGELDLPGGFTGTPDLGRVGHLGHSFGAYTAHTVAGATFRHGGDLVTYTDTRIDAIVPLSPQGSDQFGAFIDPDGTTTWDTVTVPVLGMAGSRELDDNALGRTMSPTWRLEPFEHYPDVADRFMVVLDGLGHSDLWRTGDDAVSAWIADQAVRFFDIYVGGADEVDACLIGASTDARVPVDTQRKPAATDSRLTSC